MVLCHALAYGQTLNNPYNHPHNWQSPVTDDFNDPNLPGWTIRNDKGRHAEWFNRNNVSVSNGYLELIATDQPGFGKSYAGAEVFTGDGFAKYEGNYRYGFFEMKAKVPDGGGFTAFWLSPKNGLLSYKTYPPEIDIFEVVHAGTDLVHTIWGVSDVDEMGAIFRSIPDKALDASFFAVEHVFGAEWTPDYVDYYLDYEWIGREYGEVVEELKVSISFQVSGSHGIQQSGLNNPFKIDWFKYYAPKTPYSTDPRWGYIWNNNRESFNFDGQWTTSADDQFLTGDFTNDGLDELLIIKPALGPTDEHSLLDFSPLPALGRNGWSTLHNDNTGWFGSNWVLNPDDKFIVGNFDGSVPGDEVLLVSTTKYAQMYTYDASGNQWAHRWGNGGPTPGGSGYLGGWVIKPTDKYFAFDFDNDGLEELCSVNYLTGILEVQKYQGGAWHSVYSNSMSGKIGVWAIEGTDKYTIGDFNADGRDEVLCTNYYTGMAQVYSFSGTSWNLIYTNAGSGKIDSWTIRLDDQFFTGEFNENSSDELLCIEPGFHRAAVYSLKSWYWQHEWDNLGDDKLYDWNLKKDDKFVIGEFLDDGVCFANDLLLAVRGTDNFLSTPRLDWQKDFRAALFFSPISNFWNTSYVTLKPSSVRVDRTETDEINNEFSLANELPTEVTELSKEATPGVFPNPVQDVLNIQFPEIEQVSVYNLNGLRLEVNYLSPSQIDCSNLSSGVYLLEVVSNGKTFHQKFSVTH